MDFKQENIDALRLLIESGKRKIIIVSHTNPDGDALGSSLAWARFMECKGHDVTCVVPNKYPYFLDWMPGLNKIKIFKDDSSGKIAKEIAAADIFFCMDFNMVSRLEGLGEAIMSNQNAKKVLIDHHLEPETGYDIKFSKPHSSSTAFLVYKLIEVLEGTQAITKEMGETLYVGMMTDTGNFSFSFLTAELFEGVAELVRKGVDIAAIHSHVYNSFTVDRVKLLGYALNKMETLRVGDTGIAYISLKESEMRRFKFQQGDSEGFVNYPLTVRDLSMSAIFIENRHFIRVSLRSRGDVDVSKFARLYFEGGGHKNASGGKSFLSMSDTIEYFKKCVDEYFGEQKAEDAKN